MICGSSLWSAEASVTPDFEKRAHCAVEFILLSSLDNSVPEGREGVEDLSYVEITDFVAFQKVNGL